MNKPKIYHYIISESFLGQRKSKYRILLRKNLQNKKILLRECKRYTDRGVLGTTSVVLYWREGTPCWGYACWGVPPAGGYPGLGTPPPAEPGWGTPLARWGTPLLAGLGPGWGNPPPIWTWPGYPLPRHLWKQYLTVVLRTRSVITKIPNVSFQVTFN